MQQHGLCFIMMALITSDCGLMQGLGATSSLGPTWSKKVHGGGIKVRCAVLGCCRRFTRQFAAAGLPATHAKQAVTSWSDLVKSASKVSAAWPALQIWTGSQGGGPDHLGLWFIGMSSHMMALIPSGCCGSLHSAPL